MLNACFQVLQGSVDTQGQGEVTHTDMGQSAGVSSVQDNGTIVLDSSITDIDQDTGDMSAIDPSMANDNMVELSGTLMEVDNQDQGSESGGDNDLDTGENDLADNDDGVEAVGGVMAGDQLQDPDLGSQLGEREGTFSTGIQITRVKSLSGESEDRIHHCEVSVKHKNTSVTTCVYFKCIF